jgi:hypothetical protein
MYAATRSFSMLDDRLSADFYAPAYIDIETRIKGCEVQPIRLGKKLARVFKGAFYLLASEYRDCGIPFIRVTQISTGAVDLSATVYISEQAHRREFKTAVVPGNLLFAKGGVYRHCAVVPTTITEANICQDLIGAVTSNDLDPHFAYAFLTSRFGRPQLVRWEQGDAQPHLSNDSVKHVLLPFPNEHAQRFIGDKVRQAEQLRARARCIDDNVSAVLASALGASPSVWIANSGVSGIISAAGFHTRTGSKLIRGRLDPAGYHPELRAIGERARTRRDLFRPLLEVADIVTHARDRISTSSRLSAYVSVLHVDNRLSGHGGSNNSHTRFGWSSLQKRRYLALWDQSGSKSRCCLR